jgi:RNA polymerase sigma-54 factor
MKQSLQLRLGQQLTMTPQLQQAIRLLQLSTLELQMEVQQALETNVMLETEDELDDEAGESAEPEETRADAGTAETGLDEMPGSEQTPDTMPDELPVDSSWDDTFEPVATQNAPLEDDRPFEIRSGEGDSLFDHLIWQLDLTPFNERDHAIALAIIDALDEDGLLNTPIEDIRDELLNQLEENEDEPLELDEIEAVLHRLQNFDPPGVAARNLGECLALQLRQLPEDIPWREQALNLVENHLEALAGHDYALLKRRLGVNDEALLDIVGLIQTLNPRPGSQITPSSAEYVIPDVLVYKDKGRWKVELNPDVIPRIGINNHYAGLIRRADNSADNTYLKDQLQEARWFIKSLQSRHETLLKVATSIVERQRGFLDYGEEAMKPLVLRDIAEAVDMHESTISRVTTQKFMHTPRGIFEFKYFFSSHVSTSDGGGASATAIRAMIRKLINAEPPNKPLSDNKLADILGQQGINVARRTVAKYREAMNIPPSNERKRLIRA